MEKTYTEKSIALGQAANLAFKTWEHNFPNKAFTPSEDGPLLKDMTKTFYKMLMELKDEIIVTAEPVSGKPSTEKKK